MNDYTRITFEEMLEDFTTRLKSDERFKNMTSASIYYLFTEMLLATVDMTNYYIQRTAEESNLDTAKLDSSVIKLGKNLGYNPIRNIPATSSISIVIKGRLPNNLVAGQEILFRQSSLSFTFNKRKYMLCCDYSYKFTNEDILNGQNSNWSKTLTFSVPSDTMDYYVIQNEKAYSSTTLDRINIFQGELITEEIKASSNLTKLGKAYQFYDINDIKFSNWYGKRDPSSLKNGEYQKQDSLCKVGIGENESVAFNNDNLFHIEDSSIYLNDEVIKTHSTFKPLNVCSITTNSDKTIRIRFGDGIIVSNGLNKDNESIFIQYISTDGFDANNYSVKGSKLSTDDRIYATGSGGIVDITSNVSFVFNSDITNGSDFESNQTIKNKAPGYFSSGGKLVTKEDFVVYFKNLTNLIKVKNAIAWGQDELENFDNGGITTYKYLQNVVVYCLISSLYKISDYNCEVINIYNNDENNNTLHTIYGNGSVYLNSLPDYIKMLYNYENFYKSQYTSNPSDSYTKNIKKIRDDIENKMILNTRILSLPPVVNYYDVVGDVEINSLTNILEYKQEVEKEIYEWLDSNTNFNTKIYLSDIIKFYTKKKETSFVNVNMKISDIMKSTLNSLTFYVEDDNVFRLNTNLIGHDTNIGIGTSLRVKYNTIEVPINPDIDIDIDILRNKSLKFDLYFPNNRSSSPILKDSFETTPIEIIKTESKIIFNFSEPRFRGVFNDPGGWSYINAFIVVSYSATDDIYSKSNFSLNNFTAYGLDNSELVNVKNIINGWLSDSSMVSTAERPIPLPYELSSFEVTTRQENIFRKGTLKNDYSTELSEKAFWFYVAPKILKEVYNVNTSSTINDSIWNGFSRLIMDIYFSLKPIFADSILDDNNNITNYSMDSELSVVRLKVNYKYRR